ncbi:hypothetical protein GCK32_000328, partial [Trichostrongylus colubriformis]
MILLILGAVSQVLSTNAYVIHDGGSCGTHAVPYRITVDSQGSLKLSCIAPTPCIDLKHSDLTSKNRDRMEHEAIVKCDIYKETACTGDREWTGGIMEVNNGTHSTYAFPSE